MKRKSLYAKAISEIASRKGFGTKYDPRHIEAYMRLQYSTLDHLSHWEFENEFEICRLCIDEGGVSAAESCALSYGL